MSRRVVLDDDEMARALTRMAHQILESGRGSEELVLLGIPTRGVPLAERLAEQLRRIEAANGVEIDPAEMTGSLDITMFRDDLRRGRVKMPSPTRIPPRGVDGRTVVLVDDVLSTGRTIRAALDAVSSVGRPRAVRLAVLVDRGHRELPIRPDYVGKNLPSARSERIHVELREIDGADRVVIASGDDGDESGSSNTTREA
ncbi:Bifunctional protein pyrR [Pseudoclavibacter triregionum]|nr:Bifunctional protein pyrR [Pseudoclavibacter triregionum]